jgi:CheY-like chemotaxis protein
MASAETDPRPGFPADIGRILLVDDNAELRRGLRRMLERAGHAVTTASSGREAAELVGSRHFDVVLSDVRMPDMDGIELLRVVHEQDADLPVVLVSGEPDLDSALKAVEYGALEYLSKPIETQKLRASIERALVLRRRRMEEKVALEARSGRRLLEGRPFLASDDLRDKLLGGRYRIGKLIGSGGMGAVYEAVREDTRAEVAIKVLHPAHAADTDTLRRFKREAQAVAAIAHPNIVRVFDFSMAPGEPAYIVMERLRGATLGDAIRRARRFTVEEVAQLASQVLDALEATHTAGVVHRDLKPDNVFLCASPELGDMVKLLDFGVAKLMDVAREDKLTQTGMVMGTPAYMAPEQARGLSVDARSDLYAVGCLMFEALTLQPPFAAENYNALMYEIQQSAPPPLKAFRPDVSAPFSAILAKAMSRELEARFQTAAAMAEVLVPFAAGRTESAVRLTRAEGPGVAAPAVPEGRGAKTAR